MTQSESKRYVFFAVPYDEGTAELRDAVNIATAQAGVELMRADHQFAPSQTVVGDIRKAIQRASLVIGDATSRNPNVMLEIGFAQALSKPILLITHDPGTVPFDLSPPQDRDLPTRGFMVRSSRKTD